jgi:hypothetical protein
VNGGPPAIIFGVIVAGFYYSFIGLSLAEVRCAGRRDHGAILRLIGHIARFVRSNVWRRLPLGNNSGWTKMGSDSGFRDWMDQFLRMGTLLVGPRRAIT